MMVYHHTQVLPIDFTHIHSYYEFTYCVEGTYSFHYELPQENAAVISRKISPGMLILMPPGISHGVCNVHYPYDRYFFIVTYEELNAIQGASNTLWPLLLHQQDVPKPYFWNLTEKASTFEKLLEDMFSACDSHMEESWIQMYLHHSIGLFFCEIKRYKPDYFDCSTPHYSKAVLRAKSFIDEHYRNPITIKELAHTCYLSPNYFSRQFTEQVGISPRQYLTQKRLSMALVDLYSTTLTIQEISMRNGFGDVNYFIQLFKRVYNMTPKQYQKQILEKQLWA